MTPKEFQKLVKVKNMSNKTNQITVGEYISKIRPKHKFHAKRTERNGISFPSKMEAKYFDTLVSLKNSGQILFFLRQVPFQLAGNTRYYADFMVFYPEGDIEIVDIKGRDTPLSILKRKQVMDLYPVEIKVIKKV